MQQQDAGQEPLSALGREAKGRKSSCLFHAPLAVLEGLAVLSPVQERHLEEREGPPPPNSESWRLEVACRCQGAEQGAAKDSWNRGDALAWGKGLAGNSRRAPQSIHKSKSQSEVSPCSLTSKNSPFPSWQLMKQQLSGMVGERIRVGGG